MRRMGRQSSMKQLLSIGLMCALGFTSLVTPAFADEAEVKVGNKAADFDIAKDEAGKEVKLKNFKGKWIVMTFGAHWCKPCANELPVWDAMAPQFKDMAFVAVNISNKVEDGKKFNKKLKLKNLFKVYLPQGNSATDDQYDTGTFPSTFVIDPNGVIRHIHLGYKAGDADALKAKLSELVPAKDTAKPAAK
jgi:peroxiredoxin